MRAPLLLLVPHSSLLAPRSAQRPTLLAAFFLAILVACGVYREVGFRRSAQAKQREADSLLEAARESRSTAAQLFGASRQGSALREVLIEGALGQQSYWMRASASFGDEGSSPPSPGGADCVTALPFDDFDADGDGLLSRLESGLAVEETIVDKIAKKDPRLRCTIPNAIKARACFRPTGEEEVLARGVQYHLWLHCVLRELTPVLCRERVCARD